MAEGGHDFETGAFDTSNWDDYDGDGADNNDDDWQNSNETHPFQPGTASTP